MTIAAKHLDPLVGLDIHIILIPSPAGPIPTPLPHPYVGMVLDPFDYAPFIGATTYINGLPRGQAGTAGVALPPHIPMGGPFAKPPSNESELFMGSAIVCTEDEPQSFLGCVVLSCHDIGMPPPPRVKRKSPPKSMMLPTTVVLSIPMGMIVMIGGPPTISLMGLGFAAALGALKLLKKLGPIAKAIKAVSNKIHALAEKAMKKLGLGDAARNLVHKGICAVTGHPVDIATGKVFTDRVDFELPGPIPFRWERTWFSTSTYQGPLGHGWHHNYDQKLYLDDEVVLYHTADGRYVGLPHLKPGTEYFDRKEKLTLFRDNAGYVIRNSAGHVHRFYPVKGRPANDVPLVEIGDAVGNKVLLRYDDWGRLAQIVDCAGRSVNISYDQSGHIAALAAPHPDQPGQQLYVVRCAYDASGNLITVWDALGQPQMFEYRRHLLVRETDRNGLSFYFQWDAADETAKCTRTWGDGGIYDHKLTYVDSSTTVVENSLGYKSTHVHKGGLVVEEIDPRGGITKTEYNDYNEVVRRTDPLSLVESFEFEDAGRCTLYLGPDGAAEVQTYDAKGDLVARVDPCGNAWVYEYDAQHRVVKATDPLGYSITWEYVPWGVAASTDALGHRTAFEYDSHGNLASIRDANGGVQRWEHDLHGNARRVVDPVGAEQLRFYDVMGQVRAVRQPDGNHQEFEFDGEGNLIYTRDATDEQRFTYTGLGRLASRSDAIGTTLFSYDTEGQLVAVVNELGEECSFTLDPLGEVQTERAFDGASITYERDAGGRVVKAVHGSGRSSTFSYDGAGRITSIAHADGGKQFFKYRPDGELIQATYGRTVVKRELDPLGRCVREEQGRHHIAREYNAIGEVVSTTSSRGFECSLTRSPAGDVLTLDASGGLPSYRFARSATGRETGRTSAGGEVSTNQLWDVAGRRTRQDVATNVGPVRTRSFQWGVGYRLQRLVDTETGVEEPRYDARDRLVSLRRGGGEEVRVPGATGNVFESALLNDRTYAAGGRLTSCNSANGQYHYVHDADGFVTERLDAAGQRWRYEWNGAGWLQRVTAPDTTQVTYEYDAFGRRVASKRGNKVTRWLWDDNRPVHSWTEEASVESHATTWLHEADGYELLAQSVDGRMTHVMTEPNGAPFALVDGSGSVPWRGRVDIWGRLSVTEGNPEHCVARFMGQHYDADTELCYNRFRFYDPVGGVYLSADPIGLPGGANLFGYVPDPLWCVDPLGLDWNYQLRDPDTGEVYYSGRASDNQTPADVMSRHGRTRGADGQRFRRGVDQFEQLTPPGTSRNIARGIEELGVMERGGDSALLGRNSPTVRGNAIHGVSLQSRNRSKYLGAARGFLTRKGAKGVSGLPVKVCK